MKEKIKKFLQVIINTIMWVFIVLALCCALFLVGLSIYKFFTQFEIIDLEFVLSAYLFAYITGFSIFVFLLKQVIDFMYTEMFHEKLLYAFLYFIALIIFIYLSLCFFFYIG